MNIRLTKKEKIRLLNANDLFNIMRRILLRAEKIDQNKEHAWVVGLNTHQRIMFIELMGLGTSSNVIVEPMDVFSFALQKRAKSVITVHNHPGGDLTPSHADKLITDRMIQVGRMVNCKVFDDMIISPEGYISFKEVGLMEELSESLRFVPPYLMKERTEELLKKAKGEKERLKIKKKLLIKEKELMEEFMHEEMEKKEKEIDKLIKKKWDMIKKMYQDGIIIEQIAKYSGLTKKHIEKELKERGQEEK